MRNIYDQTMAHGYLNMAWAMCSIRGITHSAMIKPRCHVVVHVRFLYSVLITDYVCYDFPGRHKQLESILGVAQQFYETLEPLTEWLTATEKCLASSEPIGTQTAKLEEQISLHKVHA